MSLSDTCRPVAPVPRRPEGPEGDAKRDDARREGVPLAQPKPGDSRRRREGIARHALDGRRPTDRREGEAERADEPRPLPGELRCDDGDDLPERSASWSDDRGRRPRPLFNGGVTDD